MKPSKLFGCVVMTLDGVSLWQGWLLKPSAKLQTKPLCSAVAQVFRNSPEQDSSFITTGPYAVASVREGWVAWHGFLLFFFLAAASCLYLCFFSLAVCLPAAAFSTAPAWSHTCRLVSDRFRDRDL